MILEKGVVDFILHPVLNIGLSAASAFLYGSYKAKKRENDALKIGMQALLSDRIIEAYNVYMEKGWIPIYALDSINDLYKSYEGLVQDDTVKGLMEQLKELPHYKPCKKGE